MPIRRSKRETHRSFFRISSLWEVVEGDDTILNVTAEILPRYASGLPEEADPDLSKKLQKSFEDNREYLINKTGLIIRKLAVEVMVLSERPTRSEKLKSLKLVLLESEAEYSSEHYMLEITFKFKPLMKPVFEPDFYHSGIVFQEELKKKTKASATLIRKRIKSKEKSIFPIFKLVKGRKKNA
jgi:hypothetical protein